ncbi:unnamed protein product [Amoebophrya sp. A120]|nr:unnamed protein product [Amoebophrya sp. A120]|eukprot:GSA120T00025081001.1
MFDFLFVPCCPTQSDLLCTKPIPPLSSPDLMHSILIFFCEHLRTTVQMCPRPGRAQARIKVVFSHQLWLVQEVMTRVPEDKYQESCAVWVEFIGELFCWLMKKDPARARLLEAVLKTMDRLVPQAAQGLGRQEEFRLAHGEKNWRNAELVLFHQWLQTGRDAFVDARMNWTFRD